MFIENFNFGFKKFESSGPGTSSGTGTSSLTGGRDFQCGFFTLKKPDINFRDRLPKQFQGDYLNFSGRCTILLPFFREALLIYILAAV
jgi:hypothetical protein